ncbi:MAG: hypothetical protein ACRDJH_08435 [Thermomicrobiales bacterium]
MPFILRSSLTRRALLAGTALTAVTLQGAHAQEGTPDRPPPVPPQATPTGDAAAGSVFAEMLALAPDVSALPEQPLQIAEFGDIPAQVAAVGQDQPESGDDPAFEGWIPAIQWITLPPDVRSRGLLPEFRELFGFDLFQVDQGLTVGEPPETITYLRGRFDETELRSAWTGAGYQELDEGGATVFLLAAEPEFDIATPVHQMVAGRFNNATILADGTIIFAASLDLVREALAVANGQSPSLAENDQVAALLSTADHPLAAAIILDGQALQSEAVFNDPRLSPEAVAQVEDELAQSGEMPPPRLALFGITPGGPIPPPLNENYPEATPTAMDNPAVWVIRLLMASPAAAETAAETIPNRIATLGSLAMGRPYAEMFTVRRSEALSDPPAVALDLDIAAGEVHPSVWFQSIFKGDLLFLAS